MPHAIKCRLNTDSPLPMPLHFSLDHCPRLFDFSWVSTAAPKHVCSPGLSPKLATGPGASLELGPWHVRVRDTAHSKAFHSSCCCCCCCCGCIWNLALYMAFLVPTRWRLANCRQLQPETGNGQRRVGKIVKSTAKCANHIRELTYKATTCCLYISYKYMLYVQINIYYI